MKQRLVVAAVFVVGCVAGGVGSQLIKEPPARADAGGTAWAHVCIHEWLEDANQKLPALGEKGWELATTTQMSDSKVLMCFKRPK